jgi:phosphoglycolate phosphatase
LILDVLKPFESRRMNLPPHGFQFILFDFDGTLIDSVPEIALALDALLAEYGRSPVGADQVRLMVGDGAARLVEQGFLATGGALPAGDQAAAVRRYLEIYASVPADVNCLYPGVVATLQQLAGQGCRMGLCTNKPEAISRQLLRSLGLAELLPVVIGGDTLRQRKPAPEPLWLALRQLGGTVDQAVMVGDNGNDVQSARAAGLPVIAVSYGYPRMPPAQLGADLLIDRFDQLPEALQSLAALKRPGGR